MSEQAKPISAAASVAGRVHDEGHFVRIEEAGLTGMVTVRGDLAGAAMKDAVAKATGGAAVPAALTVTAGKAGRAVWMSPDELLLVCDHDAAAGVAAEMSAALAGTHHMVADVSHARAMFRLTGARAGELLAKGAPVDLRDSAFPVGTARRTHLAEIAVGFWRAEPEVWELVCFRSLSAHVADWLAASSKTGSEVEPA